MALVLGQVIYSQMNFAKVKSNKILKKSILFFLIFTKKLKKRKSKRTKLADKKNDFNNKALNDFQGYDGLQRLIKSLWRYKNSLNILNLNYTLKLR